MKRNEIILISIVLIFLVLIGVILFSNKKENKDSIKIPIATMPSIEDNKKEEVVEKNRIEYPTFLDSYEEAIFIYSWFYDTSSLSMYLDNDTVIDNEYALLLLDGINTISDMKEKAYKLFDKSLVDKKFKDVLFTSVPYFKEVNGRVYVHQGMINQYNYSMGLDGYTKTVGVDDITYIVKIKANISLYKYCDLHYLVKMEIIDGGFKFKAFDVPATVCLNNALDNYE